MRRHGWAAIVLALCVPAVAQDAPPAGGGSWLFARAQRVGLIDLFVFDYPGARVAFSERVGTRSVPLGSVVIPEHSDIGALPAAARWRCDRRTRRFAAAVERPDGTRLRAAYEIRTPPCERRLTLAAPRSRPPGSLASVAIRDAWRIGDLDPRLCVRAPAGATTCRTVVLGGRSSATRHVRLRRAGSWTVELRWSRFRARRRIVAGRAPVAPPRRVPAVVVAGDSTAQNIDTLVEEALGRRARVIRAWRGGSSLGADGSAWLTDARRTAARYAPRATIFSIGANEGYPIATPGGDHVACCGPRWTGAYAARAGAVMAAFTRGGRERMLWLTLPVMRDPRRQVIAAAVDRAVALAAAGTAGVTLVHVERVVSPGGRWRRVLLRHGRRLVVREEDGIHLTVAGARLVTAALLGDLTAASGL